MRLIDADALAKVKFHGYPEIEITPSDVNAEAYKRGWNDAIDAIIESAPSIETIYGYHFNELAFVASILAKEGISPTELTRIIWDAERIAIILCKEIKDNFRKAMKGFMEDGTVD